MSDTLQTILSRAELQYSTQNGEAEFLTVLLQQTVTELKPERLSAWICNSHTRHQIATTGDSRHASPSMEVMAGVHDGGVRRLDAESSDSTTSGRHLLAASPVATESRLVLEVVEGERRVADDVLVQLADVFADLQRRRMLDRMLQSSQQDAGWQSLTAQIHGTLDNRVIANIVATDMAALLTCRRISVGRRQGQTWEVVATTGVSQPNPRSDASRQISAWMAAAASDTVPSDDSLTLIVRPLQTDGTWADADWAVVVESDTATDEPPQLERFLHHVSLALANCADARRHSPTGLLRRGIRMLGRPRALFTVLLPAAAVIALVLIPARLRIEVYGELVPTERVFVFAPDDGIITELHVEENAEVGEQDLLCVLTNEDLNVQAETIDGELAASNARLAAIDALRGGQRPDPGEAGLLSAERAELVERVQSLTKQSEILADRLSRLCVTSRMKGRVYGDRLRQTLLLRPVQRGQYLLETADPTGGWQLHLRIPEAEIRYVLTALDDSSSELPLSYSLETSPEITRQAALTTLGQATDVDRRGELSTLAIADVDSAEFAAERPGAGVVAKIDCGQRAAGFVWFRQVIEFVQRRLWW